MRCGDIPRYNQYPVMRSSYMAPCHVTERIAPLELRPSVGAPLGYSASDSLQHQFQLSIGRCVRVSTV